MAVRPIIFSAPMVRALLDGRKTMTRRVLTKLRRFGAVREFGRSDTAGYGWHFRDKEARWNDLRLAELEKYLPYAVGDLLWVREGLEKGKSGINWQYKADATPITIMRDDPRVTGMIAWAHHKDGNHAPSIHMPRWASRVTLEVTGVKVERVQDISEADAIAEGFTWSAFKSGDVPPAGDSRSSFGRYWDSLNAERGHAWETNPWIVAISFKVHKSNVDALANPATGEG